MTVIPNWRWGTPPQRRLLGPGMSTCGVFSPTGAHNNLLPVHSRAQSTCPFPRSVLLVESESCTPLYVHGLCSVPGCLSKRATQRRTACVGRSTGYGCAGAHGGTSTAGMGAQGVLVPTPTSGRFALLWWWPWSFEGNPPPLSWGGLLPSSVWTLHRAVKQGKSGGSVGTTDQRKGKGRSGERPLGTTAYGGKGQGNGNEWRSASRHRQLQARTTHHGDMQVPLAGGISLSELVILDTRCVVVVYALQRTGGNTCSDTSIWLKHFALNRGSASSIADNAGFRRLHTEH